MFSGISSEWRVSRLIAAGVAECEGMPVIGEVFPFSFYRARVFKNVVRGFSLVLHDPSLAK